MIVIELPELDVDHVEIFVTEEISVFVNVRFGLDIRKAFEDAGLSEFSIGHLTIVFPIGHKEHPMNHAE